MEACFVDKIFTFRVFLHLSITVKISVKIHSNIEKKNRGVILVSHTCYMLVSHNSEEETCYETYTNFDS